MKKILPLVILSVAAVFLLSSCDQMLESLFPSQTGHGPTTHYNNQIVVNVNGWDSYGYNQVYDSYGYGAWQYEDTYYYYVTNPNTTPIYVDLLDSSGSVVGTAQITYFEGGGVNLARTASTTFTGLKDGNYTVEVWYAGDGSSSPTFMRDNYYWYYYIDSGMVNGSFVSQVYVNGDSTATYQADLHEYTY
jgi:hypothetical protein